MEALTLFTWPPWATRYLTTDKQDTTDSDSATVRKSHRRYSNTTSRSRSGTRNVSSLRLYDEIPQWLRNNHFIKNGYLVYCTPQECMSSVVLWHNETLNIWTHLVGFFILLCILINDVLFRLPRMVADDSDKLICLIVTTTYCFTLLLSATYHTFKCMHEKAYYLLLKADVVGIGLSLSATIMSGTYYAFHASSFWRQFYLTCEFVIVSTLYIATFHPKLGLPKFEPQRNMLVGLYVVFAMIPSCHWAFYTGLDSYVVQKFLPRVIICFFFAGLALIVFAIRFPECLYPGTMDCIGASHQIWHVFVFCAKVWWHETGFMIWET